MKAAYDEDGKLDTVSLGDAKSVVAERLDLGYWQVRVELASGEWVYLEFASSTGRAVVEGLVWTEKA